MRRAASLACSIATRAFSSITVATLLNSQSFGHDLHEAPGHLAIVEQLDYAFSACVAHALTQIAVPHERQKVFSDVGNAGTELRRSRAWKHDAMAVVDPVAFPEHRLSDLPLFSHFRQESRFAVDHGIEKGHRIDRDYRLGAGIRLHLNHSEPLQPGRRRVNIAGGQ